MLAEIELPGDQVQGEGLGQVVADVVQDGGDPEKVLAPDGVPGGGGVQDGGHLEEQVQQGDGLVDVAAEGAVVLVALQGLEALDEGDHLVVGHVRPEKGGLGHPAEVGLGGGQGGQGLPADVEHIAGVKAGGDGAVEGVLPDEIEGAPAQGIDLVVDKNVAGTGEGKEKFTVVVKMQPAHAPVVIVVQLQVKVDLGHTRWPPMGKLYNSGKKAGKDLLRFVGCDIIAQEAKICKLFAKFPKDRLHILCYTRP